MLTLMKTLSLADVHPPGWRSRRGFRFRGFALAVGLALLAWGGVSQSQAATVSTVGGGPSQANPGSSSGYADGSTASDSQFNFPGGVALDPASQFLYVADTANSALRKLDLSGGVTYTILTNNSGVIYSVLTNANSSKWLNTPVDVAVDGATNIYILTQGDGLVHKIDTFGNYVGVLNTLPLTAPNAFALNASTNIIVALNDGSIVRINYPTNKTTTTLLPAGTFSTPRGIEVMDDGTIVVSDTGNNAIQKINPATLLVSPLAPTGVVLPAPAGNNNGSSAAARFNGPHHITKAGNSVLIVADTGNHQVRQIDAGGNVTLLYGVDASIWAGIPAQFYPGWLDGTAGTAPGNAEARLPEGVVVDGGGTVYATEDFYHIIRKVTGSGLSGPNGTSSGGSGGTTLNPPSLAVSPLSGYYPMGTTITVSSSSDKVFYTTDGTAPTTNSTPVTMSGGTGTFRWFNSTNDLTALQVAAFVTSGTNVASTNVVGVASGTNVVGIPGDVFAGIGSTVYLPVVIDLRTNDQVKSIGFRVEVAPGTGAPAAVTSVNVVSTSTNDFVALTGVNADANPVTLLTTSYTIGTTVGVAVSSLSPTNYLAKNFGVTAVVKVKIPAGLTIGNTYNVTVLQVSGTSDGGQTVVPLTAGPARTITIANISYLVGDTSPGRWYNAGAFGNEDLDNSDVNNVFLASLGIKVPYADSDAFNAMDTFPEFPGSLVMGSGTITMNDWLTVWNRSLRLATDNYHRGWNNGALTNSGPAALPSRVGKATAPAPGSVWVRQASVFASSVGNAVPGGYVTVPVSVNVAAGVSLLGVQFRAEVTPVGAAPALTERPEMMIGSLGAPVTANPAALPPGDVGVAYVANLAGSSNQVGGLRFRVPATATAGQVYTVSFSYLSGGMTGADPDIESVTAQVIVLGAVPAVPLLLPDQWKLNFFGSLTNPDADPSADPDGDGVPNWQEYLAGTNPTLADSRLRLETTGTPTQPAFRFLSAPGKAYVLESTADLSSGQWTRVTTFTGDGYVKEYIETNSAGGSRFYRVRVTQ